jgi:hypothetical protein
MDCGLRVANCRFQSATQNPQSAIELSSPGIEPGLRPSRSRVRCPAHSEDGGVEGGGLSVEC